MKQEEFGFAIAFKIAVLAHEKHKPHIRWELAYLNRFGKVHIPSFIQAVSRLPLTRKEKAAVKELGKYSTIWERP